MILEAKKRAAKEQTEQDGAGLYWWIKVSIKWNIEK